MGKLADWGKSNNKYITLKDGESMESVYEGARIIQSTFNPEKETIQYKLSGKLFNSGSRDLAETMDTVPVGTRIRISRTGEKNKTKYQVDILEAAD